MMENIQITTELTESETIVRATCKGYSHYWVSVSYNHDIGQWFENASSWLDDDHEARATLLEIANLEATTALFARK